MTLLTRPESASAPRTPAVELTCVSKRFGEVCAVNDVSLRIDHGERVVVLGQSGSGKSTLIRHLNGLERADEGSAVVLGCRVGQLRGASLRHLRSRVGFIFQQFELVGSATALENVLMGSLARLRGPRIGIITYPKGLRARALELLDEVGLAQHAHRRADTLSGGSAAAHGNRPGTDARTRPHPRGRTSGFP